MVGRGKPDSSIIERVGVGKTGMLAGCARIVELTNEAYFPYLKRDHTEKTKLLNMVLSNCGIDAVSLYPTYRKPFNLIFEKAKTEEWCARRDSNTRPLASEASALSS